MNNYLILSEDEITIKSNIDKIIKDSKFKDYELIEYDLTVNSINEVLEDLDTCNFLTTNKIIVLFNSLFIEETSYNKELKLVNNYLINPNDNNIFIMVASKKANNKEIDKLLENVTIVNSDISIEKIIQNNLEDFKMESRAIKKLIEVCLNNNEKILTELNKLKMYRIDSPNKLITYEDVDNIVLKEYDLNVFDIVNAITKKDKNKAIELYDRLIENTDITLIIASVASKVKTLYSIKVLRDEGLKIDEIAKKLEIKNKYSINYSLEECDNFSSKKLLKLLKDLSEIDYKSKSQNIDVDFLFKMFLLSI